ncbi:hypothetical protein ACWC24_35885 [Streptomyces sp. NPDC001443]
MNVRLLALAGVVAGAVALPLAMASAGQAGLTAKGRSVVRSSTDGEAVGAAASGGSGSSGAAGSPGDGKAPSPDPGRSPLLLGLGLATAAHCGPELTSPDGIEAQTCVMTQGEDTWARTYYRNATGDDLAAALSLMGPGGRAVQIDCAVGTEDEPGICETPREPTRDVSDAYAAVAEFAGPSGRGPLLLRSGSSAEGSLGTAGGSAPRSDSGSDAGGNSGFRRAG